MSAFSHEYFMKKALMLAKIAFEKDEVPVGSIIVYKNKIIAKGYNLCESLTDFTAHAEMQVLTSASNYLQNKYLDKCSLYVTLEPCIMCAGACYWTRIGEIIYGARDLKRGFSNISSSIIHPKTIVTGAVLENEASFILKDFFSRKR
jgi:tRNA(adenine34) deaminase